MNKLNEHRLYQRLHRWQDLKIFMSYHCFAVWDFMSLLKSLQRQVTGMTHPWNNSPYSATVVRLINEIVLAEESDLDPAGTPQSHFTLYRQAMAEVGASTHLLDSFIATQDFCQLPPPLAQILRFHLELSQKGGPHEVAAAFFYGRENIIPGMFSVILKILKEAQLNCPTLCFYLERHIDLDGEDHGPKAQLCLQELVDDSKKAARAQQVALESLSMREQLWDFILQEIENSSRLFGTAHNLPQVCLR